MIHFHKQIYILYYNLNYNCVILSLRNERVEMNEHILTVARVIVARFWTNFRVLLRRVLF